MSNNPYQTPSANVENVLGDNLDIAEAENLRRQYIKHEAAVRSVGTLYYIIAMLFGILGIAVGTTIPVSDVTDVLSKVAVAVCIAGLFYWVGNGLRRLNRKMRVVGGVLAIMGLFRFPIGTVLSLYILYLIFSAKGKMVFSDEYKAVIKATPHIKAKTPIFVWLLVILFILWLAMVTATIVVMKNPSLIGK